MGFWNAGTIAAVGGAGAGIAGSAISAASAAKQNKKQMKWARDMYELEKADNLAQWERENAYGEAMWHKINQYNGPMATMERFKEAGLNPNLVYGQGSNAPAIQTGRYDAPKHSPVNLRAVDLGGAASAIGSGLMNYVNFRESAARVSNIEAATAVANQDAVMRAVQTAGIAADNQKKNIGLKYENELVKTSLDAALQNLENSQRTMQLAEYRDQREQMSNEAYLRESAERILASRGQRVSVELDSALKRLEYNLREKGINPNDPKIMRVIGQVLDGTVDQMTDKVKRLIKRFE